LFRYFFHVAMVFVAVSFSASCNLHRNAPEADDWVKLLAGGPVCSYYKTNIEQSLIDLLPCPPKICPSIQPHGIHYFGIEQWVQNIVLVRTKTNVLRVMSMV
jgi:hypothetical protein